jgi:hypothetical protein
LMMVALVLPIRALLTSAEGRSKPS